MASKYTFELWTPGGDLLADLNSLAVNRRVRLSRNEADDISWRLELKTLEQHAAANFTSAAQLLQPGITEVRVRRGQNYIAGGQIAYIEPVIDANNSYVDVRASGFLSLFKDRYVSKVFNLIERTTIATTMITDSQTYGPGGLDANADFGITIGAQAAVGDYSITYQNQSIKDCLQGLTQMLLGFDFEFTPDKVFKTYSAIGSPRPELVFEYPGNIKAINAPYDATGLANRFYLLGSGVGEVQHYIQADDIGSQLNYKVREKNVVLSGQLDDGTLEDYGDIQKSTWAYPFKVPKIKVDGNVWPYFTDYGIGDYVMVKVSSESSLVDDIQGLHRIEAIDLSISENDDEDVTLSLGR